MNAEQRLLFESQFLCYDQECGSKELIEDGVTLESIANNLASQDGGDRRDSVEEWSGIMLRVIRFSRATESVCIGKISDPKRILPVFFEKHSMGWASDCKTTAMLPCSARLNRLRELLPEVCNLLGQLPGKIELSRKDSGSHAENKLQAMQMLQFGQERLDSLRAQSENMDAKARECRANLMNAQQKAHEEVERMNKERDSTGDKKRPGRRAYTKNQKVAQALIEALEQLNVDRASMKIETEESVEHVAKNQAEVDIRNEICVANTLLIYIREALILFLQCFMKWIGSLTSRVQLLVEQSKDCYRELCDQQPSCLTEQLTKEQWLTCFEEMLFQQMVDGDSRISFADFAFRENVEANVHTGRYVTFMALSYMFSLRTAELVSKHTRPPKNPRKKKTAVVKSCSAWEDSLELFIKSSSGSRQFATPNIVLATIQNNHVGNMDDAVLPASGYRAESYDEEDDEELMDMFSTRTSKREKANRVGMRYGAGGQCYDPVRRLAHLVDVDYMFRARMLPPYHERFECVSRMPEGVRPDAYIASVFNYDSTVPERRHDIIASRVEAENRGRYDARSSSCSFPDLPWPSDPMVFKSRVRAKETTVYSLRKRFQEDADFTKAPDARLQDESKRRNYMAPLGEFGHDGVSGGGGAADCGTTTATATTTSAVDSMYGPDVRRSFRTNYSDDDYYYDDDDDDYEIVKEASRESDDNEIVTGKRGREEEDCDASTVDPDLQLFAPPRTKKIRYRNPISKADDSQMSRLRHNQIKLMKKLEDTESWQRKMFKLIISRVDARSDYHTPVMPRSGATRESRAIAASQSKRELSILREQRSEADKRNRKSRGGYQGRPAAAMKEAKNERLPGTVKQEPASRIYPEDGGVPSAYAAGDFPTRGPDQFGLLNSVHQYESSIEPLPFTVVTGDDYDLFADSTSSSFTHHQDRTSDVSGLEDLGNQMHRNLMDPLSRAASSSSASSRAAPANPYSLATISRSARLGPGPGKRRESSIKRKGRR